MQAEAREALAQAKEMAKMQMELERQKKKKSPIADIVSLYYYIHYISNVKIEIYTYSMCLVMLNMHLNSYCA